MQQLFLHSSDSTREICSKQVRQKHTAVWGHVSGGGDTWVVQWEKRLLQTVFLWCNHTITAAAPCLTAGAKLDQLPQPTVILKPHYQHIQHSHKGRCTTPIHIQDLNARPLKSNLWALTQRQKCDFAGACTLQFGHIALKQAPCVLLMSRLQAGENQPYKTFAISIFMVVFAAGLFTSISQSWCYTVYFIMLSTAVTRWVYPESWVPGGPTYPGCSCRINMILDATMVQCIASGVHYFYSGLLHFSLLWSPFWTGSGYNYMLSAETNNCHVLSGVNKDMKGGNLPNYQGKGKNMNLDETDGVVVIAVNGLPLQSLWPSVSPRLLVWSQAQLTFGFLHRSPCPPT